jgi:hypothetical protein
MDVLQRDSSFVLARKEKPARSSAPLLPAIKETLIELRLFPTALSKRR